MNYTIRDLIMWRWCTATFLASLLFSIFVAVFHPWNLALPQQAVWLVPPITPSWLVWPIANSLFVLVFVWVKTNQLVLKPTWSKTRWHSYLRAILQALLVVAFSSGYDLHGFVIGSIVISVFISTYFSSTFEDANGRYGPGSTLVFFYTIIALAGLAKSSNPLLLKQALLIFLFNPLAYLLAIVALIVLLLILLAIGYGLQRLLAASYLDLRWLLRQVGQWTLSLAINTFVATGLLITVLCLGILGLWKGACRGTRWLLPAHQS